MRLLPADYLRLAAAARLEAANAVLEHARQKHLVSAVAWEGLALSARKMAEGQAKWLSEQPASLEISP